MAFPDFYQPAALDALNLRRNKWWISALNAPIYHPPPTPSTGSIYNVRVEANDYESAEIRWSYNGVSNVKLYRSTDNISYSLVDTIASTYPTVEYSYTEDHTLLERTLYYFKLTDDDLLFTAPVHVVTYINSMPAGNAQLATISLYPATDIVTPEDFNALVNSINYQNQAASTNSSTPCDVCSQNGALVINCTSACQWFQTILTEDINSISLVGCDGCPPIDFVLPPNSVRSICGWPIGCDYDRDECFQAPVQGGPDGRIAKTNGISINGYWNGAGGPGGGPQASSCSCANATTSLTILACNGSTLSCS